MRARGRAIFILSFLAPAFLLFTVFVAIPSARALTYSLQKWDGLSTPQWVGLKNFAQLLKDRDLFLVALGHNLLLMVVGGALTLGLSLFFAAVLHRRIRGASLFRVAFFFPNVISSVAIALLWVLLYSTTSFGVINNTLIGIQDALRGHVTPWIAAHLPFVARALHAAGIHAPHMNLPFAFTASENLIYSLIPMIVWMGTGFYMVLFLAAMEGIPETLYEAARLDGASEFAQFRHVTLPLIREVLTVGVVFLVIGALKFFDAIWVMENQWPRKESHVMATLLYDKVFNEYNVGYGSAVAVLLFILVFLGTLISLRMSRKEALEY